MTNEQKYIKEYLQNEAFYIGDEGDMACFAKTELGAWRKFRARIKADCGDSYELQDLCRDNIGIGWFKLTSKEENEKYDSDWLVLYEEKTPYEVWIYRN